MHLAVIPEILFSKIKNWSLLSITALFLGVVVFLILTFLNPLEIGPNGILAFFLALYLLGVVLVTMSLKLFKTIFKKKISALKVMYLAATIAFAPVMLLALNTLNQLQPLDLILVLTFESLAIFYLLRRLQ